MKLVNKTYLSLALAFGISHGAVADSPTFVSCRPLEYAELKDMGKESLIKTSCRYAWIYQTDNHFSELTHKLLDKDYFDLSIKQQKDRDQRKNDSDAALKKEQDQCFNEILKMRDYAKNHKANKAAKDIQECLDKAINGIPVAHPGKD